MENQEQFIPVAQQVPDPMQGQSIVGGPPTAAPQGTINYTVVLPNGKEETWPDQHIVQQLQRQGAPIVGYSSDGSSIAFQDEKGLFHRSVPDVLAKHGVQVKSAQPSSPSYDTVNPAWRATMAFGGMDDDAKKSFLESKIRREWNVANPNIMGSGDDWFVNHNGQWYALTNKPGMDSGDIYAALPGVAKAIAATFGGLGGAALGTAGGPAGTIAGGALGAAGAGAAANAAFRGGAALLDPEYKEWASQHLGTAAGDIGKEAAFNAALGGAFPAAGAIGERLAARGAEDAGTRLLNTFNGAVQQGPISRVTQAMAKPFEYIGEKGGRALQWLGKSGKAAEGAPALEQANEMLPTLVRDVGITYNPAVNPLAPVATTGMIAQWPAGLIKLAHRIPGVRERLMSDAITARNVGGAAGEAIGEGFQNFAAKMASRNIPDQTLREAVAEDAAFGAQHFPAIARKIGQGIGEVADVAATVGRGAEKGVDALVRGGINAGAKTAQVLGNTAERARDVAQMIGPYEVPLTAQYLGRNSPILSEEQRLRSSRSGVRPATLLTGLSQ